MCAINPKKARKFTIEFYTAHEIDVDRWEQLVMEKLLMLEQEFNKFGEIRVHINEIRFNV